MVYKDKIERLNEMLSEYNSNTRLIGAVEPFREEHLMNEVAKAYDNAVSLGDDRLVVPAEEAVDPPLWETIAQVYGEETVFAFQQFTSDDEIISELEGAAQNPEIPNPYVE
jgi:hypothetical protein